VRAGVVSEWEIDPSWAGYSGIEAADLDGGEPAENAALIERVLTGGGPPAARAAVVLNAAAAILVSGLRDDYRESVALARTALEEGAGARALDGLRRAFAAQ